MCYYRGLTITNNDTLKLSDFKLLLTGIENQQVIDGFAYGSTPVVVSDKSGGYTFEQMEWGFIPHYLNNREAVEKFRRGYTDDKGKYHPGLTTLNAIGEEMLQPGKMYRSAALGRRCLFMSTQFYEWRHIHPIGKRGLPLKTAVKYPYAIRTKNDSHLHLIAGIWQPWTDKETGETVNTCSLITTKANPLMQQIHNTKKRMPCILTEALAVEWLSNVLSEERVTEIASFQMPAGDMEAWPIHKDFKTAECPTEPMAYNELPPLENV